jgi:hypothetical protein
MELFRTAGNAPGIDPIAMAQAFAREAERALTSARVPA